MWFEKRETMADIIDKRIVEFINSHHVLTLATSCGNRPYCCNCYYAYDEEQNIFVIKGSDSTRHALEIAENPFVAGSVVLETDEIGKIQGLQFTALAVKHTGNFFDDIKKIYLKRFPYAVAVPGEYLSLEIDFLKMTDNRFGFGKKLIWTKSNCESKLI